MTIFLNYIKKNRFQNKTLIQLNLLFSFFLFVIVSRQSIFDTLFTFDQDKCIKDNVFMMTLIEFFYSYTGKHIFYTTMCFYFTAEVTRFYMVVKYLCVERGLIYINKENNCFRGLHNFQMANSFSDRKFYNNNSAVFRVWLYFLLFIDDT